MGDRGAMASARLGARLALLVAVHATNRVCCHALPVGADARAPAVHVSGIPLAVVRAHARAPRRRCGVRRLRGGEGLATPNATAPGGLMADSNATERSEVDGILVSFCEPEPAAAAARRPLKFADRFWGGALCAAAAGLLLLRVAGQGSAAWIERALDPWMRDEARLDLYLGCFITAVFGAGAIACRNVLDDPGLRVKKHAWVISVLAAGVCFVAAVLVYPSRARESDGDGGARVVAHTRCRARARRGAGGRRSRPPACGMASASFPRDPASAPCASAHAPVLLKGDFAIRTNGAQTPRIRAGRCSRSARRPGSTDNFVLRARASFSSLCPAEPRCGALALGRADATGDADGDKSVALSGPFLPGPGGARPCLGLRVLQVCPQSHNAAPFACTRALAPAPLRAGVGTDARGAALQARAACGHVRDTPHGIHALVQLDVARPSEHHVLGVPARGAAHLHHGVRAAQQGLA